MSKNERTDDQVVKGFNPQEQDLAAMLKKSFENSDFTTTDEQGNQTFFGMKVDASMKNMLDLIFYNFIPHVAKKVQYHGAKVLQDTALKTGIVKTAEEASHFGLKWAPALAYATIAAEPLISLGATAVDTTSKVNELRKSLAPIAKSSGSLATAEALFNASNNEVIANARKKIYDNAWARIAGTLARAVVTVPAIGAMMQHQKTRTKEMTEELLYENALKSPEAMKEYVESHVKVEGQKIAQVDHHIQSFIKQEKEAYIKEFEAFKNSDAGRQAAKKIEKLFLNEDYLSSIGLKNSRGWEGMANNGKGIDLSKSETRRQLFKARPDVERAYENELKYVFVEDVKNGLAFDDNWLRKESTYNERTKSYDQKKPEGYRTVLSGYEEMRKSFLAKQQAAGGHEQKSEGLVDKQIFEQGIYTVAAVAGTQIDRLLVGDLRKEVQKPVALNLILHMRKALDGVSERVSIPNYGQKSGDSSISKFVHEIFQEHQEDCKKPLVGGRYFQHLQGAKFNDEAFFQMKDEELSGYEVAIKHIARAIKEGDMDPIAMINLVGQRKIVQADGKNFGPKGANGKPSAIIEEINKQCACIEAHQKITAEELSAIMGNLVLTEADFKAGFAGGSFKGEERAFMFMLLESQVKDEATLEKLTGLGKHDIQELKKQGQAHFAEHFDAAIMAIATMTNEDMGNLAKHDITVDEIKLIRAAAQEIQATGKHASDALSTESKQAVEQAVMNVLGAEAKDGQNFWQERVKARAKDAIKEALEQEAPKDPVARLAAARSLKEERGAGASLGTSA